MMTVTLNLPPDVEARIAEKARINGLPVPEFLQQAIAQLASAPSPAALSREDWERELTAEDDLADAAPPSAALLRREHLYD